MITTCTATAVLTLNQGATIMRSSSLSGSSHNTLAVKLVNFENKVKILEQSRNILIEKIRITKLVGNGNHCFTSANLSSLLQS
jgi:O-acetylhomoserine/O-acetylserine sulfhydrylase-like pyridoxal-dependent enzyme